MAEGLAAEACPVRRGPGVRVSTRASWLGASVFATTKRVVADKGPYQRRNHFVFRCIERNPNTTMNLILHLEDPTSLFLSSNQTEATTAIDEAPVLWILSYCPEL